MRRPIRRPATSRRSRRALRRRGLALREGAPRRALPLVVLARLGRTWSVFRPLDMVQAQHGRGPRGVGDAARSGRVLPDAAARDRRRRRAVRGAGRGPCCGCCSCPSIIVTLNTVVTYGQTRFRAGRGAVAGAAGRGRRGRARAAPAPARRGVERPRCADPSDSDRPTGQRPARDTYVGALDGLRAIAVAAVIVFHFAPSVAARGLPRRRRVLRRLGLPHRPARDARDRGDRERVALATSGPGAPGDCCPRSRRSRSSC